MAAAGWERNVRHGQLHLRSSTLLSSSHVVKFAGSSSSGIRENCSR